MKKNIVFLLIFIAFGVKAQQENHYTQFMYNKLLINPAFAGAREVSSFTGLYRQQWIGFEGAPVSQLLSFDTPLLGKKLGLGLTVHHHTIGAINDTWMANMSYSYSLVKTETTNIKLGIGGSFRSYRLDMSQSTTTQANDPAKLATSEANGMNGNIGAGLYFTHKDFYVGVSLPNIYENIIGNGAATITSQNRAHIYAMAGAVFPLGEKIDLRPAVIAKYTKQAPLSVDANLSLMFVKKVNAGVSYRFGQDGKGDSVDFLLFYQASPKFGIGAAYDYTLSELSQYNTGSVEALLRYDISSTDKGSLTNPRFFF